MCLNPYYPYEEAQKIKSDFITELSKFSLTYDSSKEEVQKYFDMYRAFQVKLHKLNKWDTSYIFQPVEVRD